MEEVLCIRPTFNRFGFQNAKLLENTLRKHDLKRLEEMRKKSTQSGIIQ